MRHVLVIGLCCVACGDPIAPRQNIEKTRVLAARSETLADANRATPERGEPAIVRVLVASPAAPPPLSWALATCERDATLTGIAGCAGTVTEVAASGASPEIAFAVPSDLPDAGSLLVLGVVCPGGTPNVAAGVADAWPEDLGCVGGPPLRLSFDVFVAPRRENQNPTFADASFDGAAWPAEPNDVAGESCSSGLLVSADGRDHRVAVTLPGSSRETVDGKREQLQLSWFSSAGELDLPVSYVEADDSRAQTELAQSWTAPGSAPPEGRRVLVHFVLRDGRGGVSWMHRSLCAVP